MARRLILAALGTAMLGLSGCVILPGQPPQIVNTQPVPTGCVDNPPNTAGQGGSISCQQPDGSWHTAMAPPNVAPPPPPPPDNGYPPPPDGSYPPPGYNGGGNGY